MTADMFLLGTKKTVLTCPFTYEQNISLKKIMPRKKTLWERLQVMRHKLDKHRMFVSDHD